MKYKYYTVLIQKKLKKRKENKLKYIWHVIFIIQGHQPRTHETIIIIFVYANHLFVPNFLS